MKLIIIAGLLIAAALSLVTNLVSNFLSQKVKKYRRGLWILFGILIIASIIITVIPQEVYSAKVEILDVAVSNIYQEKQNDNLTHVYCEQQVKLVNRGNANSTLIKYTATLKYQNLVAIAKSFSSQAIDFTPNDIDSSLGHFEISAYPFVGDSALLPLPSVIIAQDTLDFVGEVHFAFNANSIQILDVHSGKLSQTSIPILVQYQFEMADGSKLTSDDVPCAFVNVKTVLAPSP